MSSKQKILYSQCWEDPALIGQGLNLSTHDTLVIITSGGDNVLSLLINDPKEIIAVDHNLLQNFLLEIKIAAIKVLEYEDFISFLGVRDDKERWAKYLKLRDRLSPRAISFWDTHRRSIEDGVLHCGRFEKYVKVFRNFILPLIHNRRTIEKLFSFEKIEDQKRFYQGRWKNKRWQLAISLFFDRKIFSRFGRSQEMFNYCEVEKTGKCFSSRLDNFFENKLANGNYFLTYLFTGKFQDHFLPSFFKKENFSKLKSSVERVKIVTSDIDSYIEGLDSRQAYKFCLSDIFESRSIEETQSFFDKLVERCGPGSRVCFWNNLVDRFPKESSQLSHLSEYSKKLHAEDRVFIYKKFFVYEKK